MGENMAFVASLRLDVSDPSSSESEHSCWAGAAAGAFSGGVSRPDVRRRAAQLAVNDAINRRQQAHRRTRSTRGARSSGWLAGERPIDQGNQRREKKIFFFFFFRETRRAGAPKHRRKFFVGPPWRMESNAGQQQRY